MAEDNRKKALSKRYAVLGGIGLLLVAVVVGCIFAIPALSGRESGGSAVVGAPDRATSADLYCSEFSAYSGPFVEDGTNEQVENVMAVLIENRSDEFLDAATVVYNVGDDTATFVLTGLPAGESVWVLERSRRVLEAGMKFEFVSCDSSFRNDIIEKTDKLEVITEDNAITVTNKSSKALQNVCVYYKTRNSDGNFLGGITYMLGFDNMSSGETAEKQSAHFGENSEIVRYSFQE